MAQPGGHRPSREECSKLVCSGTSNEAVIVVVVIIVVVVSEILDVVIHYALVKVLGKVGGDVFSFDVH